MALTNHDLMAISQLMDQKVQPIHHRLDCMDGRLNRIDERLDHMDSRLNRMDERLDHMDERLDHMDERLDHMDERLDHMDERLDQVDNRLDRLESNVSALKTGQIDLRQCLKEVNLKVSDTYKLALDAWGTSMENRNWLERNVLKD